MSEIYELLAIRYAHNARRSPENFIGGIRMTRICPSIISCG